MTKRSDLEYFATIEDPTLLANAMYDKIRDYRTWCAGRGLITLWENKLKNYYGVSMGGNTSQAVTAGGSEGELALIKVNDLHTLINEQLVTVTSQRPAGRAQAVNSDTASLKASKIGTAIAEYYMAQVGWERKFIAAALCCLLCDEAYSELFWDESAGDAIGVDPETQQPMMSGEAILRTHAPWNVARDPSIILEFQKWKIISMRVNRFEAAAKYPKFAEQILTGIHQDLPSVPMDQILDGSDAIFQHLLVHDRTAAVPEGRYSLLIGDQIVLDTVLPFKPYPIERIAPEDVIDGSMGYAPVNDILAMEQVTDALHSIITTNQVSFGGQSIVGPIGANIKVTDIAKGLRYFELPPDLVDKLRPLQLTQTPGEVFNYIQTLSQKKERTVGSVASSLAQQASQGASGSSMALIQTQAISFNSITQGNYFRLLSGTMTKLIEILRTYADTPRIARIVGKSKSSGLKEFKYTGEDLNSISSINYEMVNPISQTWGGRIDLAKMMIEAGQVKSPKQLVNLIATGQMDVLIEDDEADGMLILEENEALMEGRPAIAVITEMHGDHIKSHNSLITQAAKEKDPDLVQRVTAHVMQHIQLWSQASATNPGILFATNQQPLPQPPPPMMGPPPPGGPGGPPPGAPPPGAGKVMGSGQSSPASLKAAEVQKPELPTIAGTDGEKPTVPGVSDPGPM